MRWLLFILMLPVVLFGYFDSDLDGVDDAVDGCPNTPLSEIVDESGCSVEVLAFPPVYTLIVGEEYIHDDPKTLNITSTYSTSFEFDYFYKNFLFQLQASCFSTKSSTFSDSGLYDTSVYLSYTYAFEEWVLQPTFGVIFPTYKSLYHNNNTDYYAGFYVAKNYKRLSLFSTLSYTFVQDGEIKTDLVELLYQNQFGYSFGVSYIYNKKISTTLSWSDTQNTYKNLQALQTVAFGCTLTTESDYFVLTTLNYGVSEEASDYSLSLKLGYNF